MIRCTRCGRLRREKFIVERTIKVNGKKRYRCAKRSVCASIGRRKRERERRQQATG